MGFFGVIWVSFWLLIQGCGAQPDQNSMLGEELSAEELEQATAAAYAMVEAALRPYRDVLSGAIVAAERPFFATYLPFENHCKIDVVVAFRRQVMLSGITNYFAMDLRARSKAQAEEDRSHLGLLALPFVGVPNRFNVRYDRGPRDDEYPLILSFQRSVGGWLSDVLRRNPQCETGM